MPKCNNCRREFEAYSIESTKLPVINQPPLEVVKLTCPVCGGMQHLLTASPSITENNFQIEQSAGIR